jgi:hypothetical protein
LQALDNAASTLNTVDMYGFADDLDPSEDTP